MRSVKRVLRLLVPVLLAASLCFLCTTGASAEKMCSSTRLKVGIAYGSGAPKEVTLSCPAGLKLVSCDRDAGTYTVEKTLGSSVTVRNKSGKLSYTSGSESADAGTTLYFVPASDTIGYASREYKGIFELAVSGSGIRVIDIISLENYIKGVLPKEVYPSWPEEALKTAAVAARTFAVFSMNGKHASQGFDVCTTTCCQVFSGNGKNEYPTTNAAVEATKNEILTYAGKPAMTVYHSSTGDATESAAGCWGGNAALYPYLVSVKTPFETPAEYPNGLWSQEVSADEMKNYFVSRYPSKIKGCIRSFDCEYGESGYVRKLTVTDEFGGSVSVSTSDAAHSMMSKYAKSGKFTITPHYEDEGEAEQLIPVMTANGLEFRRLPCGATYILRGTSPYPEMVYTDYPDENRLPMSFTVDGVGYGHGVGLSQFGSMTLAKNGYKYTAILSTYFPGTVISVSYN